MKRKTKTVVMSFLISLLSLPNVVLAEKVIEIESYNDIVSLFDELGYTKQSWDSGLREINRVYLLNMPSRWRGKSTKEIQVQLKKGLFFRVLLPLILRSNELIMQDRDRLVSLVDDVNTDAAWVSELAVRYHVVDSKEADVGEEELKELINRVDIIPPSLAMAQTAEESGWGTSRFADVGNSMFGQWAWGENAIKPEQQRAGKGNYGIAAFNTLQDSIDGYMMNINTHRAYAPLRDKRALMRSKSQAPTGVALAPTLLSYSERGQHYVDTLNSIMSYNKLEDLDEASLTGPVILLKPVGDGSD